MPTEPDTLLGTADLQVSQGRDALCTHGAERIDREMVNAVYMNQSITK